MWRTQYGKQGKRVFIPLRSYQIREGSIATENRHTGKPHQNRREVERRLARLTKSGASNV